MNENDALIGRIRALLNTAEDPALPPEAAEAYTAKAAELVAKYGIEAALVQDRQPTSSAPTHRKVTVTNPWAMNKVRLLCHLTEAMVGQAVHLGRTGKEGARQVHLFGFASDLDRAEMLYTSLLLQMANALAKTPVPAGQKPKSYRHSWLLGFIDRVTDRVADMELRAAREAETAHVHSTALVLSDRFQQVKRAKFAVYSQVRREGASHSSRGGFSQGSAAGARADIGGWRVGAIGPRAIGS